MDDDSPIQILPFGRTAEQQAKLDRAKAQGKRGAFGCLLWAFALALFAVYCAGYMQGKLG